MIAHTPGPWFSRPDHDPVRIQGAYEVGLNIAFASGGDSRQRSEYMANARLIAAAPELLEALRYAEAFIAIAVPSTARDREEAINEVLPAIRAAIAKATGSA